MTSFIATSFVLFINNCFVKTHRRFTENETLWNHNYLSILNFFLTWKQYPKVPQGSGEFMNSLHSNKLSNRDPLRLGPKHNDTNRVINPNTIEQFYKIIKTNTWADNKLIKTPPFPLARWCFISIFRFDKLMYWPKRRHFF